MKAILFLVIVAIQAYAITPNAIVTRVIDGDTIVVKTNQSQKQKVRLWGIDAPEMRQKSGSKSGRFLTTLLTDQRVYIDVVSTDKHGRLVANVYDSNGVYINEEMIRIGLAWVYANFVNDSKPNWYELQANAQKKRIGLWRYRNPIPPWEYRQKRRKKN
ncbi:MAG: thermonuclease family protein [Candidatus Margulisiibacteriota bacterium]|nr:thermonuclease family protein [Candidatus Margulisiibacteriota bacterium]